MARPDCVTPWRRHSRECGSRADWRADAHGRIGWPTAALRICRCPPGKANRVIPTNVLITAASRRVPLVNAFRAALARQGGGRVVVTDVNALSPAVYSGDRAYLVPLTSDPT